MFSRNVTFGWRLLKIANYRLQILTKLFGFMKIFLNHFFENSKYKQMLKFAAKPIGDTFYKQVYKSKKSHNKCVIR